jgi:hypothetical protein
MVTIPVKTRLEANGTLNLRVPTGLPESDVDVVVIVQPVSDSSAHGLKASLRRLTALLPSTLLNAHLRASSKPESSFVDLFAGYEYVHSIF